MGSNLWNHGVQGSNGTIKFGDTKNGNKKKTRAKRRNFRVLFQAKLKKLGLQVAKNIQTVMAQNQIQELLEENDHKEFTAIHSCFSWSRICVFLFSLAYFDGISIPLSTWTQQKTTPQAPIAPEDETCNTWSFEVACEVLESWNKKPNR